MFFRPVGHYQWHWILKNEGREGQRETGREGEREGERRERDGEEDGETPLSITLTMMYKLQEG